MTPVKSKYRLTSTAFERADENEKIDPKKIVFLSVEGDETERTYFQNLNRHLDQTLIQIEVLRHRQGDGYSDPRYVIELLDEYLNVRQGILVPSDLLQPLVDKYSIEVITQYMKCKETLEKNLRRKIEDDLFGVGIDIEYRRYLEQFDNETDIFAIVIDRDCGNHSRDLMEECIQKCRENNYECYISNPCFEFWLLLHLCDVKSEFCGKEKQLYENPKVSDSHTFVSLEVSKRAHHKKTISPGVFDRTYYPNITKAIENAKAFEGNIPNLIDNLGTNLSGLLKHFGY